MENEKTTQLVSRNETTHLCTAVDRLQPPTTPTTACNRLQPPAPPAPPFTAESAFSTYLQGKRVEKKNVPHCNSSSVPQQPMTARAYCAYLSVRDHWVLRFMSRCPDQVVSLKRDPEC
ncbi:hypothetical protein TNCV_2570781 [Trichonephila clavipes]|nr:hypothetical protein TNCV_2570781 [Trichonephila clavipes]